MTLKEIQDLDDLELRTKVAICRGWVREDRFIKFPNDHIAVG